MILDVRWAVVGFLGSATMALPWLDSLRAELPDRRVAYDFRVTSDADSGPGSLREGLMGANRADGPARLRLPSLRIVLRTALPPLVNPHGVILEGVAGSELDGAALTDAAVLDVLSPVSRLRGFVLRNAAGDGLRIRARRVEVDSVAFLSCGTAVRVLSTADEVALLRSRFEDNGIGVAIDGGGGRTRVAESVFHRQRQAGIWAVAAAPVPGAALVVRGNRFDRDDIGVAALNVPAQIEDNDIAHARTAAIFVSGREHVLRNNRARGGRVYGICAVGSDAATIEGNETDGNLGAGLLVRDAQNSVVRGNRVYANGFGIVMLFGDPRRPSTLADNLVWDQRHDGLYIVGGSPIVSGNEMRVNRGAGLRIDDFEDARGRERRADPLLRDNTFDRNGADAPARGRYLERRAGG